jgi:hypothetical protein
MNRVTGLLLAGLILILHVPLTWGGPPNPTGSDANGNTAGGTDALANVTTNGEANTAFGYLALSLNTVGDNNTACGYAALQLNAEGINNTARGFGALQFNPSGNANTALGYSTLWRSTGSHNIAVGSKAGLKLRSGSDNIYLRHPGVSSESQTMRLGSTQTRTFIAGVATAPVSGTIVFITPAGQLGILGSSARYKRDIQDVGVRSQGLLQLRRGDADPVRIVARGARAEGAGAPCRRRAVVLSCLLPGPNSAWAARLSTAGQA